jgi:hypothetical protein
MVGWSLTIVKDREEDCGGVICGYHVICLEGPREATKVIVLPLFIHLSSLF